MRILFVLLITLLAIEIGLFIEVGEQLGALTTVLMVFTTAVVGLSLVKSQGIQALLVAQQRLQKGDLPVEQAAEGALLALAGVLLFIPGFFSDVLGALLLLPWVRHYLAARLKEKVNVDGKAAHWRNINDQPIGNTFEGEFERKAANDDVKDDSNKGR
ncbi:MAG: FxsA family protein [Vibrionaceae bacterium]